MLPTSLRVALAVVFLSCSGQADYELYGDELMYMHGIRVENEQAIQVCDSIGGSMRNNVQRDWDAHKQLWSLVVRKGIDSLWLDVAPLGNGFVWRTTYRGVDADLMASVSARGTGLVLRSDGKAYPVDRKAQSHVVCFVNLNAEPRARMLYDNIDKLAGAKEQEILQSMVVARHKGIREADPRFNVTLEALAVLRQVNKNLEIIATKP